MLDEAVAAGQGERETVLVMDADRTLVAADKGLFSGRGSLARGN